MRSNHRRPLSPFAFTVMLMASLVLALGLALPINPTHAFAGGSNSNSVVLCVERSKAKALALELGVSSKQATLSQDNPDAAEGTVAKAADSCTWEVLMDVSAQAVEDAQVVDGKTADNLDDGGYLIVCVSSSKASAKELLAWAKQADGVLFAEKQTGTAIEQDTEQVVKQDTDASEANEDEPAKGTFTNYFSTTPTFNTIANFQWFLNNTGKLADGKTGFDLNPVAGIHCSQEQVVAIIDGGVDYNNPALAPYMVNLEEYPDLMAQTGANKYGFCGITSKDPSECMDGNGHGSHCAGIVIQAATEGGTAGNIRIMAVRAGDETGYFGSTATIRCYEFVTKAREAGVNVVAANASFGGAGYSTLAERVAMNQMIQSGVAIAMAAGNDGAPIDGMPTTQSAVSSSDGLLIVGASDPTGNPASFSDYGKQTVNIFAPGATILSTVNEAHAEFLGALAAQNARDNVPDTPHTLIYESFERGDEDASIGGGLSFSYATCEELYDDDYNETYEFTPNDTPLEYSSSSLLGKKSLIMGQSDDTQCVISNVIDPSLAAQLEMIDLCFKATGQTSVLNYGFLDENGTWYSCEDYERVGVKNVWVSTGMQAKQVLLKDIQDAMIAGTHQFRLVLRVVHSDKSLYVDSVALGYGAAGYAFKQGTSMATPMVTGLLALAAAEHPQASARELCAYVLGGGTQSSNLQEKCSTSTNASIAGMSNPAPVITNAAVSNGVLTVDGFFFGGKTGTLKVGGKDARILSWQRFSGNAYTARVGLPSSAKDGFNELIISTAQGTKGRTVKNLGKVSWNNQYQDLPVLSDTYDDPGYTSLAATSNYIYAFMVGGTSGKDFTTLRAYRYAKSSGTWSKVGDFDWAKIAGSSFALSAQGTCRTLNVNGTLFLSANLNAKDYEKHSYDKAVLFRFDASAKQMIKVAASEDGFDNLFVYGSKLYNATAASVDKKGKSSIKSLKGWPTGNYLVIDQMDKKTGAFSFKGAVNLKCMGDNAAYVGSNLSFIDVANRRLVAYCTANEKPCMLTCKMSTITSRTATFARYNAPFADDGDVSLSIVNGSVALFGAKSSSDAFSNIWLFSPKGHLWTNTKIAFSDASANSATCTGGPTGTSILYVSGEEDATANLRVKFIRAINLEGLAAPIDPAKPVSVKASKAGKKSMRVSWAKSSGATSYQICYSTKKSMKYKAYTTTKSLKKTIKKLKKGQRYYVKVRAYRTVKGSRIYSDWSTKRSVKL